MDHNVPRAVTNGLRLRGVDIITAYEDGTSTIDDSQLLDRAIILGRVLFTSSDADLLVEAAKRQQQGIPLSGVVYAHQLRVPIGKCINDLELIVKVAEASDLKNEIQFLPL